jgi:crotonobetaine/carnitine-CoA ligase
MGATAPHDAAALHAFAGWDANALLTRRAAQRPDRPALVWAPFDGPELQWTYASLLDAVDGLARGLVRRGVRAGDRVLIHLDNSPESVLAWFACARVGAEAVTTSTRASADELRDAVSRTRPVGAVTQSHLVQTVEASIPRECWLALATGHGSVDGLEGGRDDVPPLGADPRRFVSIQFTSGTTSRPKGVRWTHANALWGARVGAAPAGLRDDDVHLVHAPLSHTMGWSWQLLATLWAGGTVVLQPRFSSSRFWDVAVRHRCTWTYMVPFCVQALAQIDVPPAHSFRCWGGWVDSTRLTSPFGVPLVGSWGMTEVITQGIFGDLLGDRGGAGGVIGRPSPEYSLAVVDDDGAAVTPGGTGSLRVGGIRGLSLFAEYLDDPSATTDSFDAAGRFVTGDRVTVLDDGTLRFADREKDMLKVGGENVGAAEIERVVARVPGVREVAVIAGRHAMLGEVPLAVVVVDPTVADGSQHAVTARIVAACRHELADFKVPREVHVVDALPRGNLDKVLKAELRARFGRTTT